VLFRSTDGSVSSWAPVDALPSQTGNAGEFLTTDGTTASWAVVAGSLAQPTEPTSPTDGQIWVDTDGTALINQLLRWSKAPANGTTTLSGNDDNSVPLTYSVGYEQVFQNGALLARGSDYTATSGTSISLTNASVTGDIFEVFAAQPVAISDVYTQTQANATFINDSLLTTTGDTIYASGANTPARLGIGTTGQVLTVSGGVPAWGAAPAAAFVGASAYVSGSQSITASTLTTVDFANENFDTDSFHSTSSNTSRMTIPSGKAGKYLVTGTLGVDVTSNFYTRIQVNGNPITGSSYGYYNVTGTGDSNINRTQLTFSAILDLAVADYVQLQVVHSSTTARNLEAGRFDIVYLGA
jgi:hypothetical protein